MPAAARKLAALDGPGREHRMVCSLCRRRALPYFWVSNSIRLWESDLEGYLLGQAQAPGSGRSEAKARRRSNSRHRPTASL